MTANEGPSDQQSIDPASPANDPLRELLGAAETARTDGLLVIKDGSVVAEQYAGGATVPVELMSVTKSIVSLAIGFLIDAGRISSVDCPLSRWYPSWRQGPKSRITLRHVLTHTTGLAHGPDTSAIWVQFDRLKFALERAVVEEPGARFDYNNEAVQLLSGVVTAAAGVPLDRYLERKLFGPLGIKEWSWERDPAGNVQAFSGLSLTAPDLARIGVMLLQGGRWNGETLLSPEWIRQSTSPGLAVTPFYGLLWHLRWARREPGAPGAPGASQPDAFFADGWLGQRLAVYPAAKLVAVRLHRAVAGGGAAENEQYGFPAFFDRLEAAFDLRPEHDV